MEIRRLINIVKRWIWLCIAALIIGLVGGYYFSSRQEPIYQASSRFIVVRAIPDGSSYDYDYYNDIQTLISTYTELLSSNSLLSKAAEVLGNAVYEGSASAERVGQTQFVRLTFTHTDPEKAAIIANGLVEVLIEQNEQLQSVRYDIAEENLKEQRDQAQEQMALIQKQIDDLSKNTVAADLNQTQLQIDNLQFQISDLESRIALIDPLTASDEEKVQLADYEGKLELLTPALALYKQIYTNLVVLEKPIEDNTTAYNQINQLQTNLALYQNIYVNSINSLENLRLSRLQNIPTVVQTEMASIPNAPISPQPVRSAMLTGIVGLLLAAGIAFMIEYLDDTIKTPEDVELVMDLPVIGIINEFSTKRGKKNTKNGIPSPIVISQPRSPVAEAYRSLRTNLEFSAVDESLKTLLVTSAGAGEGKTTTAANLAITLAQSGKKILLLDSDMRRPSIHRIIGISNRKGLSDVLLGRLEIDEVIISIGSPNPFYVIPSGGLPPNPAELLNSKKMATILEQLKTRFDMIVLDSSPMVVTDPLILSQKIDGVMFVVLPGKTRSKVAFTHLNQLKRSNARVLGVVLNRISQIRLDYYYGGYDSNKLDYQMYGKNQEYEDAIEVKN